MEIWETSKIWKYKEIKIILRQTRPSLCGLCFSVDFSMFDHVIVCEYRNSVLHSTNKFTSITKRFNKIFIKIFNKRFNKKICNFLSENFDFPAGNTIDCCECNSLDDFNVSFNSLMFFVLFFQLETQLTVLNATRGMIF